ncbi:hypothetical protein [Acinetobacter bereziniae]|nr:hypothetical protein [Acinetobacter bereziniae]
MTGFGACKFIQAVKAMDSVEAINPRNRSVDLGMIFTHL